MVIDIILNPIKIALLVLKAALANGAGALKCKQAVAYWTVA
jgi:hypothetical protein